MPDGADPVEQQQPPPHKPKSWLRRAASRAVDLMFPDDADVRERGRWIERKFQSVMLGIMTSAIVWGVVTLTNVDKSQALTAVKLQDIEIRIAGAYPAAEAKRDVEFTRLRLDTIDRRVDALDGRVQYLERRAGLPAPREVTP